MPDFVQALFPDPKHGALVAEKLVRKEFPKGHNLVVPGQVQHEMYFVESGEQMSFFETAQKWHVQAFTYAPGFSAVPESFLLQAPSHYTLTCLSESVLHALNYHHLQGLFEESHDVERAFRLMTEKVLTGVLQRHLELHTLGMEERFRVFCQRSPHLLQRVPHKYLASYLGIDPTNFSKLYNSVKI